MTFSFSYQKWIDYAMVSNRPEQLLPLSDHFLLEYDIVQEFPDSVSILSLRFFSDHV